MLKPVALAFVVIASALSMGCKKTKYPTSCGKAVTLTEPWTELGFPTDKGRVCESGGDSAKYMFLDAKVDEVQKLFEDAVIAKGYVKDKCTSLACDYKGDADKITIQPYDATAGKTKYVTISLRRYPIKGGAANRSTNGNAGGSTAGAGGDCNKYFERFAACDAIDAKVKQNMAQLGAKLQSAPADKGKQMCDAMSAGWEKTLSKAGC